MMQPSTLNEEKVDDDKYGGKNDSSDIENSDSDTDTNVEATHPAVRIVFRTDNILEKICSHLDFKDLKQFRLVSRSCNEEGRRALIKRDKHWIVVESRNKDWLLELDKILRSEEKTYANVGDSSKNLLGWMFKRLLLVDWRDSLGKLCFLQQWGHFLRKIHWKNDNYMFRDEESDILSSTSHPVNMVHNLLSMCCPNLDEMVVIISYDQCFDPFFLNWIDDLIFTSPSLNLKCLRIKYQSLGFYSSSQRLTLQRFFSRLVTAAGAALEKLEIEFYDMESILKDVALNVGENNFQCLKELTLQFAGAVSILPTTVLNNFPELTKLIICNFNCDSLKFAMEDPQNYRFFPDYFPVLKSLTIHHIYYDRIADGRILLYLQNFPNLELLNVSACSFIYESLEFPSPVAPRCESLRSFSFNTKHSDLRLLRCVVNFFPNLLTLNLLEFGKGDNDSVLEPEYSFGELVDTISPLSCLQQLYVNQAFHTSQQLVDAVQLMSNLTALETLVLVQSAHNDTGQRYNVSLYLTILDPDFQHILNWDGILGLKSLQLVDFRFGTTQEEVEEAAAKGEHVSFGRLCSGYVKPWIREGRNCLNKCQR